MQLSEKATIAFLYSIVKHPFLGLIIEPFLVEVTVLGNYSLAHQRLISANANLYSHLLGENDYKAIKLLEEITPERLIKKFYTKGSIRPKEFFEKKCDETMLKTVLRPYIERRLSEALGFINEDQLFFSSETKNPTAKKLSIVKENVSVLFHFNRNEIETRYYATIKCNSERLKLLGNSAILTYNPAHIIIDNKLIVFVT